MRKNKPDPRQGAKEKTKEEKVENNNYFHLRKRKGKLDHNYHYHCGIVRGLGLCVTFLNGD